MSNYYSVKLKNGSTIELKSDFGLEDALSSAGISEDDVDYFEDSTERSFEDNQ